MTIKDVLDFFNKHPELLDEALDFLKKRKAEKSKTEPVTFLL